MKKVILFSVLFPGLLWLLNGLEWWGDVLMTFCFPSSLITYLIFGLVSPSYTIDGITYTEDPSEPWFSFWIFVAGVVQYFFGGLFVRHLYLRNKTDKDEA